MKVPAAIKARAAQEDVGFLDLWHDMLTEVRDSVSDLTTRTGAKVAHLRDAVGEVERLFPWLDESDTLDTAWVAMSFGIGSKLWEMRFIRDGEALDPQTVRELIRTDGDADLSDVFIEFPLLEKP